MILYALKQSSNLYDQKDTIVAICTTLHDAKQMLTEFVNDDYGDFTSTTCNLDESDGMYADKTRPDGAWWSMEVEKVYSNEWLR